MYNIHLFRLGAVKNIPNIKWTSIKTWKESPIISLHLCKTFSGRLILLQAEDIRSVAFTDVSMHMKMYVAPVTRMKTNSLLSHQWPKIRYKLQKTKSEQNHTLVLKGKNALHQYKIYNLYHTTETTYIWRNTM